MNDWMGFSKVPLYLIIIDIERNVWTNYHTNLTLKSTIWVVRVLSPIKNVKWCFVSFNKCFARPSLNDLKSYISWLIADISLNHTKVTYIFKFKKKCFFTTNFLIPIALVYLYFLKELLVCWTCNTRFTKKKGHIKLKIDVDKSKVKCFFF